MLPSSSTKYKHEWKFGRTRNPVKAPANRRVFPQPFQFKVVQIFTSVSITQ